MATARSGQEQLALEKLHEDEELWGPAPGERPTVVAEILSDGTVQVLDRASVRREAGPWESGVVGGAGWTLWWERRRWS